MAGDRSRNEPSGHEPGGPEEGQHEQGQHEQGQHERGRHEASGPVGDGPGEAQPPAGAVAPPVICEVDLPAAPDDVWDALTDPARVGAWFGAPVAWELAPGAPLRVGPGDDGAPARQGSVDEVEPGRRLAFRWWPTGDPGGASAVTYELEPHPGGTHLVVTERPAASGATASAAVASTAVVATGTWDVRIVGLWLGFHAGLRCPV